MRILTLRNQDGMAALECMYVCTYVLVRWIPNDGDEIKWKECVNSNTILLSIKVLGCTSSASYFSHSNCTSNSSVYTWNPIWGIMELSIP